MNCHPGRLNQGKLSGKRARRMKTAGVHAIGFAGFTPWSACSKATETLELDSDAKISIPGKYLAFTPLAAACGHARHARAVVGRAR
jgi:hypothetical protein